MHSKLLAPAWRWTIKAMIKAGLLPGIGHYDLHLRDRLCDAVRGTPLARMRRLQGWQRVDQSKPPTVPRGIVEGLFDHSFIDEESRLTGPAPEPHSSLAATSWFQSQTGHAVPSGLSSRADMQAVLPHADAMHTGGTVGDSGAVLAATGVLAAPGVITAMPHRLAARRTLNANLRQGNHAQLQSQLSGPAASWQSSSASTFAADPTTNLGEAAALPAAMASGGVGGGGMVEEEGGGDDMAAELEAPVMAAAGSSRKDKERLRQKKRRLDPAVRTEENRKRMWRHYKKHHGTLGYGTLGYGAWKSAGEPARPPP